MGNGTNPTAGGAITSSAPAGGPASPNFTTIPYTSALSVPGAPFWGPGSTFINPSATGTGQQLPEIITGTGQAYSLTPSGWQQSGANASVPTATAPPMPNAPPNSTPGASLNPYLAQSSIQQLESQLSGSLPGAAGGASTGWSIPAPNPGPYDPRIVFDGGASQAAGTAANGTALTPQFISSTLGNFFGGLPQTVSNPAPAGGYQPGYAIPQNSVQYVPGAAVANLTQQLEANPLQNAGQVNSIVGNWASGLGSLGPSGVSVPNLTNPMTGSTSGSGGSSSSGSSGSTSQK
jgi:hypothetical protein